MNVLHVFGTPRGWGGMETYVRDLVRCQSRAGIRVSVAACAFYESEFKEVAEFYPVSMERSRWDLRLRWQLSGILRGGEFDVLHVHSGKAARLIAPLLKGVRVSSVVTVHGVKTCNSVFGKFDRILVPSQKVGDALSGLECEVVWNGVELSDPSNRSRAIALKPRFLGESEPVICAAGRFASVKGFDLLLEAVAQSEGLKLWLVGDGPEAPKLKKKVAEKGLESRVWMPGFIEEAQLRGLMSLAGLFVISSLREGGPLTLAEALMEGCPVLATEVGMAPDFLPSDFLIPPGDLDALSLALRKFLAVGETYRQDQQEFFKKARRQLDWGHTVARVERVYQQLTQRPE